ncbi:MAG: hypothetical protein AB9869_09940 [Verrucomicrobiia bacterium]
MNRTTNARRMLLALCVLIFWGCSQPATFVFELQEPTEALNADFALAKARESLARAGFDLTHWDVKPGTGFEQFGRKDWGRFHFTDGKQNRCVQVHLQGDRIICGVVQLP